MKLTIRLIRQFLAEADVSTMDYVELLRTILQDWETARVRSYRTARIFEPSADGWAGAMAVHTETFGPAEGEAAVVLPDGTSVQEWELQAGKFPQYQTVELLIKRLQHARQQRDEARALAAKLQGELDLWLKIQK